MSKQRRQSARRAISLLIDEFGADFAVHLNDRPELSTGQRARARILAENRVEGCTACPLHMLRGGNSEPLTPYWSPHRMPRQGRIAVLVDAPTTQEHRARELGHGPMFGLLRSELRSNGIEPERVTYLSSVACTPLVNNARRGMTRLPPAREHVTACGHNTLCSLDAADVTYVLLLGGHAVRSWRADLQLSDIAGRWYLWRNQWLVCPVEHPSVALKRSRNTEETSQWREQVGYFCRGVNDGVGLESLSHTCVRSGCGDTFYVWDDDGVPWCEQHFRPPKFTSESRKARTKVVDTAQQRLM